MAGGVKAGTAYVDLEPGSDAGLQRGAADAAGGVNKTFGGMFKGLAVTAGAIFAGVKIGGFLKDAIGEYQESAKVGRLSEAVIKSTGAAANVTAGQMGDLANALAAKSGVDDEVIQSGENVLATFTNVRNEVGKGNDIFSQATGLALDMSQALGTDLQGANIQLGKALNDPIKGITALSRVGVSFTQQQKDQIATLVQSGDTLGAQKVILQELQKEFGGAAAAAADPIAQLQVVLGNAKETIGSSLAPLVSQVVPVLSTAVTAVAPALASALGAVIPALTPIIGAIGPLLSGLVAGLAPIIQGLTPVFSVIGSVAAKLGPVFAQIGTALGPVAVSFGKLIAALLPILPLIASLVANLVAGLAPILPPIIEAVTKVAKALLGGLGKALDAILPALVSIATILGGVIARVFVTLAPIIARVADLIGTALATVFRTLGPILTQVATLLGQLVGTLLTALLPILPTVIDAFLQLFTAIAPLLPALLEIITTLLPPLIQLLALLLPPIVQVASIIVTVLVAALVEVISWVTNLGDTFTTIWHGIQSVVSFVLGVITGVFRTELNIIKGIWETVWGGISSFVSGIVDTVVGAVRGLMNGVIGIINRGIRFLNDHLQIHVSIDDPTGITDGIHFDFDGPHIPTIPTLHGGGTFSAPFGAVEGLALLRDQETVRTPEQEAGLQARSSGPGVNVERLYAWDAREAAQALEEERAWAALTGGAAA